MSDRNLTVVPLATQEIDGITIQGDAFGALLSTLAVQPKVLRTDVVMSAKVGDETRAYLVEVHEVPGPDGESQQVYACTCPAFKYHELPYAEDIEDDVPAGLAAIGTCKHGRSVEIADRSTDARDDGQGGLDAFADDEGTR